MATPGPTVVPLPAPVGTLPGVPDPETPTHYGMRYADFVEVNEAMMQTALEDPEIIGFSKQVEAMIAQRDAMIIEAACRKKPAVAEKIRTMQRNATELKRKGEQQAEQIRAMRNGNQGKPAAPKG